jgi:AcrR family transcriptional regulator
MDPVPSSTDSEPADRPHRMRRQRRAQILEAAKAVFAEHGYHKAAINEIIRRAGIARGTFYLYFESKQKVFDSILAEALEQLRSRLFRIETDGGAPPPQVQLRQQLVQVFQYLLEDRHFTLMLLRQGLGTDTEVAERVTNFYGHAQDLIHRSLERGMEMGILRQHDPNLISAALLGAVRGILAQLIGANEQPDYEKVVDELIAFALRGVLTGR